MVLAQRFIQKLLKVSKNTFQKFGLIWLSQLVTQIAISKVMLNNLILNFHFLIL